MFLWSDPQPTQTEVLKPWGDEARHIGHFQAAATMEAWGAAELSQLYVYFMLIMSFLSWFQAMLAHLKLCRKRPIWAQKTLTKLKFKRAYEAEAQLHRQRSSFPGCKTEEGELVGTGCEFQISSPGHCVFDPYFFSLS